MEASRELKPDKDLIGSLKIGITISIKNTQKGCFQVYFRDFGESNVDFDENFGIFGVFGVTTLVAKQRVFEILTVDQIPLRKIN